MCRTLIKQICPKDFDLFADIRGNIGVTVSGLDQNDCCLSQHNSRPLSQPVVGGLVCPVCSPLTCPDGTNQLDRWLALHSELEG